MIAAKPMYWEREVEEVLSEGLSRALELLRDEARLAEYLGVPALELLRLRNGNAQPPRRVFKRLSTLLARQ